MHFFVIFIIDTKQKKIHSQYIAVLLIIGFTTLLITKLHVRHAQPQIGNGNGALFLLNLAILGIFVKSPFVGMLNFHSS